MHSTATGHTYTYSTTAQRERPQAASTFAAPTHRAQVQAATEPDSISSVFGRYLETNRKLVNQYRTQTRELLRQLEQQSAEIRLLQDEREALFHFRPLGKRKREGENQQADSGLPINYFGERPDLSPFLRLPEHQYLQEPQGRDTWRITDQHGPIVYDTGVAVNVENTLERFVLPRQVHRTRPNLYLLECTSLVPTPDDSPSQRLLREHTKRTYSRFRIRFGTSYCTLPERPLGPSSLLGILRSSSRSLVPNTVRLAWEQCSPYRPVRTSAPSRQRLCLRTANSCLNRSNWPRRFRVIRSGHRPDSSSQIKFTGQ